MAADDSLKYFGNAWRSLKATPNLFGKLLLLVVIQIGPILGPIVAFGYFLGWAREAAWGMDTPLPAHLFGRDDKDFWSRGAKAFLVNILYALIVGVFASLAAAVQVVVPMYVSLDETAFFILEIACAVVSTLGALFFVALETVGLMRLAIYNRFGAAFQWGVCARMLFHHFGGIVKIALTFLLVYVVLSIPVVMAYAALTPAILGTGALGVFGAMGVYMSELSEAVADLAMNASLFTCLITFVACTVVTLLVGVVGYLYEALMWRSFGNWVARFDVPSWGGRFDPLPYERQAAPAHAQPQSAVPVQGDAGFHAAPQAEKRCHPLLVTVLSLLLSVLVAAAASVGTYFAVEGVLGDAEAGAEFEEFVTELGEEIEREFEDDFYSVDFWASEEILELSKFV